MGTLTPDAISSGTVVALDTVPWIYFLENHPVHRGPARRLFERIEAGELTGVMSSLVFAELLVPAYRTGDGARAASLRRLLTGFPHLEVLDLNPALSAEAARLRAKVALRTPDAIHVATALAGGALGIVTNDRHFERVEDEIEVWFFEPRF